MDPEERLKLFNDQTDDIYRAIGKFSVKFEQLIFYMGQGITFFLSQSGLKNQQLSNIVLAGLTAQPVKNMFSAMIYEFIKSSDSERKIVKEILNQVQSLIERRNDIVHSTWFVGWANPSDTDFREVSGHKLTKGSSGAGVKVFNFTSADFDQFSDDCDSTSALVKRLWGVIIAEMSIESNFYYSDSGELIGAPNPNRDS